MTHATNPSRKYFSRGFEAKTAAKPPISCIAGVTENQRQDLVPETDREVAVLNPGW